MGRRASGRTAHAGGPRNKVTTPDVDHGRLEPGKMPRPHKSPPLGRPRRRAAGFRASRGPEEEDPTEAGEVAAGHEGAY
eukprot:2256214-Alexandrium_andersonii.AAC.1